MVGQTVSHYRVLEELGRGGMGVVYKALDLRLNRFVALKFLSSDLTKDRDANDRFRQEAQAASALDHPNICTIHEIDETPGHELFLTMAYYDGETLKKRIERGPLAVEEAIEIAVQITQALSRAHESGIVHRDVKPANVMMTKDGLVKILDFGLAKLKGTSDFTKTSATIGTVAYMPPEQIRGGDIDARTDVWAVGVVLYEMLAGRLPFEGQDDFAMISSILEKSPRPIGEQREGVPSDLERIVDRALRKEKMSRYASARELLTDLMACRGRNTPGAVQATDLLQLLHRPVIVLLIVLILIAAAVPVFFAIRQSSRARWAREEAIPQIIKFADADDYAAAFAVAKQVDRYVPNDPALAGLWDRFSLIGKVITQPDGAEVYVQPYAATDVSWEHLGQTPLQVRLAKGVFRFRVEKGGYEPRILAVRNPSNLLGNQNPNARSAAIALLTRGSASGMVPVASGAFPVGLTGFNSDQRIEIPQFLIDVHEVTNRQFKQFVDRDGYRELKYWNDLPIVKDGKRISPQDALREFVDSTGRPGPAVWELGEYSASQAEYPVTGVSWYEAVAYCRAAGKTLPTIYHWSRAAVSPAEIAVPLAPAIIPFSNFAGKGVSSVGSYQGLGPYGTYDMAGNAREWVWNEAAGGRRWILGGAWNDPDYMFVTPYSLPPFDRSATNGFRCATYGEQVVRTSLLAQVETYARNNRTAKAVSDEVFDVFKRQLAPVKYPLNARAESRDTSSSDWIKETISFDAGYETGRIQAYLYLPLRVQPPYQLVVLFPGVGVFAGRASSKNLEPGPRADYIVKSGRAVIQPAFKGSYERWDPFLSLQGDEYLRTFRTRMFQWRMDLSRILDVMSERPDIDTGKIAYLGLSFGGSTALPLIALEDRIKTAILAPGGFTYRDLPPEADAINYLSRIRISVLMLGGRHDYIFPLETSQKPMFERLGTPADQKRHVVFDTGHNDFPRSEMIREVLGWLDRYIGPVRTSAETQHR